MVQRTKSEEIHHHHASNLGGMAAIGQRVVGVQDDRLVRGRAKIQGATAVTFTVAGGLANPLAVTITVAVPGWFQRVLASLTYHSVSTPRRLLYAPPDVRKRPRARRLELDVPSVSR